MVVRAFAALVAAAVAGVLTPGPATAEEPKWHRATCFGGSIDSIELTVEVTQQGQALLTLSGHLDCGSSDKRATFGWAHFDSDDQTGTLSRNDLRRYRGGPRTPFTESRYVKHGNVNFMACVVTDYDVVVDCVQVAREPGKLLEVTPLLEKDATYGRDVIVQDGDYRPVCGGCW